MNEYEIITRKGLEYVRAERYELADDHLAMFYRGGKVCRTITNVIKVIVIDPKIVATWKPEGGRG